MKNKNRLIGIDVFRGYAISFMLIFHFVFDLQHFSYINLQMSTDFFWSNFRYLIVSMFLFTMGLSLKLTHNNTIKWEKVKKRTLILGFSAFIVSIGSYMQFPSTWIYFGVLHFVLFSSFILLPILNYPKTALLLALIIFISYHEHWLHMEWLFKILVEPLHLPKGYTEDIVRLFPWLTFPLLGIGIIGLNWHYRIFNNQFFNRQNKANNTFALMGQNSLLIYLVHQPLFFAFFMLISQLK